MLVDALGQEVVANIGAAQEEAVPILADGGDDALVAPGAYFYLVNTLRQTHVQREADGLSAIVDENSADGHAYPLVKRYIAIVYRVAAQSIQRFQELCLRLIQGRQGCEGALRLSGWSTTRGVIVMRRQLKMEVVLERQSKSGDNDKNAQVELHFINLDASKGLLGSRHCCPPRRCC